MSKPGRRPLVGRFAIGREFEGSAAPGSAAPGSVAEGSEAPGRAAPGSDGVGSGSACEPVPLLGTPPSSLTESPVKDGSVASAAWLFIKVNAELKLLISCPFL